MAFTPMSMSMSVAANHKNSSRRFYGKLLQNTITNPVIGIAMDKCQNINNYITANATDISALCRENRLKEALVVLQRSICIDSKSYACVFLACGNLKALREAEQVHTHMIVRGIEPDVYLESNLLSMYAKCGNLSNASLVFEMVPSKNLFCWNAMMIAYSSHGSCEDVLGFYHRMQREGVQPNNYTFPCVLKACAGLEALKEGKEIHDFIITSGFESNIFVGNSLVTMYAKCGSMEDARNMFDKMCRRNVVSWNALISGYAHGGQGSEALQMFRQMQLDGIAGDLFSWNTAIMCCAQNGRGDEAMKLFCRMQLAGVRPDPVTIVSVLPACANSVALEQGREIHAHVFGNGFESDLSTASALVDMYAKCGGVEDARQVFDEMPQRNVVSWSAMIAGYAKNGYAEDALALFHQMKEAGIMPNHVTFTAVLSACGHAGLLDEGLQYFDNITNDYQLVPSLEHHACIVDLLGRSGCLDKARDFIIRMPLKPDAYIWGALLGACRIHCNVELGEFAAKHLFELDPENTGNCVLLSTIYAAAGRCVM